MFRDSVTCTLGLIRTRWTVTMAQHQPLCNANGIEWLTLDSYSAPLMVDATVEELPLSVRDASTIPGISYHAKNRDLLRDS